MATVPYHTHDRLAGQPPPAPEPGAVPPQVEPEPVRPAVPPTGRAKPVRGRRRPPAQAGGPR